VSVPWKYNPSEDARPRNEWYWYDGSWRGRDTCFGQPLWQAMFSCEVPTLYLFVHITDLILQNFLCRHSFSSSRSIFTPNYPFQSNINPLPNFTGPSFSFFVSTFYSTFPHPNDHENCAYLVWWSTNSSHMASINRESVEKYSMSAIPTPLQYFYNMFIPLTIPFTMPPRFLFILKVRV